MTITMPLQSLALQFQDKFYKKTVDDFVRTFYKRPQGYTELMKLSLGQDSGVAFRASWVLEGVVQLDLAWFEPHVTDFLNQFTKQRNESSLRHFYKILALLTVPKNKPIFGSKINSYDFEELVEWAFQDLLNPHMKVAVKSHILNVLANLSCRYHWIKDALEEVIDLLIDKESIAFFAKVKMIRKQLKSIP
ncbi:MAG: hypothetical protein EOO99_03350 [Pedobacter sp.]|nr:MAG: hypothetical protein EOO99_03350 [Pedobacter sp.]